MASRYLLFLEKYFLKSVPAHTNIIYFYQVSSVEIERICNGIDDTILETAAISVPLSRGGPERLVIAVIPKNNIGNLEEKLGELKKLFNSSLQKKLNPLFKVSIHQFVIFFLFI